MHGKKVAFIILYYLTLCKAHTKPLFSIGQDILSYHQVKTNSFLQQLGGLEYNLVEWANALKYGWTDQCTSTFVLPILAEEFNRVKLKGLGNITFGLEYCLYNNQCDQAHHTWTVLGCVLLSTAAKKSSTMILAGNDSLASFDIDLAQPTTSYILGTTFDHNSDNYYFSSVWNMLLQTNTDQSMYRPTLCYNMALGHILHFNHKLNISIMIEMNGRFRPSTNVRGIIDDHSGSYRLWLGPSLRCTYRNITLHVGLQYPIAERFFAPRTVANYRIGFDICIS